MALAVAWHVAQRWTGGLYYIISGNPSRLHSGGGGGGAVKRAALDPLGPWSDRELDLWLLVRAKKASPEEQTEFMAHLIERRGHKHGWHAIRIETTITATAHRIKEGRFMPDEIGPAGP